MSKRNTEARDQFFIEHLDEDKVKEIFDLSHRDFCKLFYNNSQYNVLRSMGERFEELALREKGGYLASYYLITLQDLICAHIIANIGEELYNNHNFEVKVSKSCVQLTTECKEYLIHGLMGNPEVSTWVGKDNAPIEAIHNNEWKAVVFDLMNNAITAGPSFFIATQLIYDNIQAFEVHVKDTRQNHLEKKYFEKILAKRTEVDDEDAFSFTPHNASSEENKTKEESQNNEVNQVNQPNYHKNYPKYKKNWKDFKKDNTGNNNTSNANTNTNNNTNSTNSSQENVIKQENHLATTSAIENNSKTDTIQPNTTQNQSKPYYKKPYYKKDYQKNQSTQSTVNEESTSDNQHDTNNTGELNTHHSKMKM